MDNFGVKSTPALCILYADFSLTSVYFAGEARSQVCMVHRLIRCQSQRTFFLQSNFSYSLYSLNPIALFADTLHAGQPALLQNKAVLPCLKDHFSSFSPPFFGGSLFGPGKEQHCLQQAI